MNHTLKSALLRFLRVALYSAAAGAITFLVTHGQDLVTSTGLPNVIVTVVWPTVSALLVAADKVVRALIANNQ